MSTTTSIEEVTNYIKNNYITIEELANRSNISLTQLEALINNFCIPKHSHEITKQIVFSTDVFGKSVFTEEKVLFYHPSLIELAMKANRYLETSNFTDVANKIKSDFVNELRQSLIEIENAKQVFDYCFDNDGNLLDEGVEKIMLEHWPYIMDGTYGVCLKEVSAKNMILKNIAVSILEEWINYPNQNKDHLYDRAQYAAELYDKVASLFGPHEVLKSTRGRLFNQFNSINCARSIMKKELTKKPEIKLIGLSTRTNNKNEMDPKTAKISELATHFWNLAHQIPYRKNPGTVFSVYTEYDSDEHGDYTFFIGEEVHSFENIPNNLQKLIIPAAQYQKFTTPSGKMPTVVIDAWQQIWKMTTDDFGGKRAYQADFEVYDERARDPANTSLDIYIGISDFIGGTR